MIKIVKENNTKTMKFMYDCCEKNCCFTFNSGIDYGNRLICPICHEKVNQYVRSEKE